MDADSTDCSFSPFSLGFQEFRKEKSSVHELAALPKTHRKMILENQSVDKASLWALILPAVICLSRVCPPRVDPASSHMLISGLPPPKPESPIFSKQSVDSWCAGCAQKDLAHFSKQSVDSWFAGCAQRDLAHFSKQSVHSWSTDCAQKDLAHFGSSLWTAGAQTVPKKNLRDLLPTPLWKFPVRNRHFSANHRVGF